MVTYLFQKRGVYYFERRIPKDVRPYYSANKIIKSLRTKNQRIANTMSLQMSSRLDLHWASLRVQDFAPVAKQLITDANEKPLLTEIDCMTFSQAAGSLIERRLDLVILLTSIMKARWIILRSL